MENLIKKASYLKGLCDGLEISEETKRRKSYSCNSRSFRRNDYGNARNNREL